MGNSDNTPNDGKLSLDTSAPLWSAILREVSKGQPIADFSPPKGLERARRRRLHRPPARAVLDRRRSRSCSSPAPRRRRRRRRACSRPSTRHPVCCGRTAVLGPKVTRAYFNLTEVEANHPAWQTAERQLGSRARPAVLASRGGPEGHADVVLLQQRASRPFGRSWGAPLMPRTRCPLYVPPPVCDPVATPTPASATASASRGRRLTPRPRRPPSQRLRPRRPQAQAGQPSSRDRDAEAALTSGTGERPRPQATPSRRCRRASVGDRVRVRRSSLRRRPRRAGRHARNARAGGPAAVDRTASRRAPVPSPWMMTTLSRPASAASSR